MSTSRSDLPFALTCQSPPRMSATTRHCPHCRVHCGCLPWAGGPHTKADSRKEQSCFGEIVIIYLFFETYPSLLYLPKTILGLWNSDYSTPCILTYKHILPYVVIWTFPIHVTCFLSLCLYVYTSIFSYCLLSRKKNPGQCLKTKDIYYFLQVRWFTGQFFWFAQPSAELNNPGYSNDPQLCHLFHLKGKKKKLLLEHSHTILSVMAFTLWQQNRVTVVEMTTWPTYSLTYTLVP